jgi:hypothetical protein
MEAVLVVDRTLFHLEEEEEVLVVFLLQQDFQ